MSWVLLEEDCGWCIVHEKNILQAGNVNVGETCNFWYQGQEYAGKVLMIDGIYDRVNEKLTKLKKDQLKEGKQPQTAHTEGSLPPKRKITAVDFYGASSNSNLSNKKKREERSKMSEEAKNRQRLQELNRKEAEKQSSNELLTKLKNNSANSVSPGDADLGLINEDEDSQDSVISDVVAHRIALSEDRTNLLKSLKGSGSSSKRTSSTATRQGTNRQSVPERNTCETEKRANNKPLLKGKNETVSDHAPLSDKEESLNSWSEDQTHLFKSQTGPRSSSSNMSSTAVMQGENRKRILKMNVETRKWAACKNPVPNRKKLSDADSEWVPSDEDTESQDSQSTDMAREEQIYKPESLNGPSFSPTKEELKRQNELLKMKVQLAYEEMSEMNKKDKTLEPRNKGNANEVQGSKDNHDDGGPGSSRKQGDESSKGEDDLGEEVPGMNDNEEGLSNEKDDSMPVSQASSNGNLDKSSKGEDDILIEEGPGIKDNKEGASNEKDDSKQNDCLDSYLDYQLYGERKDITTELCRKVYCRKDVLATALTNASNVNHLCRRLMHGVFIPSKIVHCTVSGQSWHAGGPEKLKEQKKPLHPAALRAILDFSNGVAKRKKWPTKKLEHVRSIFSLRLGEIRKLYLNGKLKD